MPLNTQGKNWGKEDFYLFEGFFLSPHCCSQSTVGLPLLQWVWSGDVATLETQVAASTSPFYEILDPPVMAAGRKQES